MPKTHPSSSSDHPVLVDESPEAIGSSEVGEVGVAKKERGPTGRGRRALAEGPMRPVRVVMLDVLGEDGLEMPPAEDEHAIKALASESADDALADGVRPRCADRGLDDPDGLGGEDGVEGSGELGVAIPDQELDRRRVLASSMQRLRACWVTQLATGWR